MRLRLHQVLFWVPRILAMVFALFVGLPALGAFSVGIPFRQALGPFLLQLIPAALVLIALTVAWHRERLGALIFASLGLLYIVFTWGAFPWFAYLVIAGPPLLLAVLFMVSWVWRGELEIRSRS